MSPFIYMVKAVTNQEAEKYAKSLHQDMYGTSVYDSLVTEI